MIFLPIFFLLFHQWIILTLHISSLYCCLDWYLAHSSFCYILTCFLPSQKITLLATKNVFPPTVFDLGGWNWHHSVGNWVAETVTYHFFNIRSLSSKNMQHKRRNMQKMIFWRKKKSFASQMFIIEKFEKTVCQAVSLVMVNEIKSSNLFYL